MLIKTLMRYHDTPVGMLKFKRSTLLSAGETRTIQNSPAVLVTSAKLCDLVPVAISSTSASLRFVSVFLELLFFRP